MPARSCASTPPPYSVMPRMVVGGRLNRRPGRRPERVDAGGLVQDLGDVPAFLEDGHAEDVVLEPRGAAAAIVWKCHGAGIMPTAPRCGEVRSASAISRRRTPRGTNRSRKWLSTFGFGASMACLQRFRAIRRSARRFSQRNARGGGNALEVMIAEVVSSPTSPILGRDADHVRDQLRTRITDQDGYAGSGADQDAIDAGGGMLRLEPSWVPRSFMIPGRAAQAASAATCMRSAATAAASTSAGSRRRPTPTTGQARPPTRG